MSNEIEQDGDYGKIDCTVTFPNPPQTLWGNKGVMAAESALSKTLLRALTSQAHGRINREGVFTPTHGTVPVINFIEVDERDHGIRNLMDQWLAGMKGKPLSMPEMVLSPEIVAQVKDATGVDVSEYKITDIQRVAPHVINITLG